MMVRFLVVVVELPRLLRRQELARTTRSHLAFYWQHTTDGNGMSVLLNTSMIDL